MAKQIIPGVHNFTGLVTGRVYLLEHDDGLTVVDAGLAFAAPRIIRQIQALGHRPTDVRRILITHAHLDHVGGLPELKKLTDAEVIASEVERPFVEGEPPPRDSLSGLARLVAVPGRALPGTHVDRTVADGDVLPGGLQVVFSPGHAPGHVAFWEPERRILFCGDVVMNLFGLSLPFAAFTPDMEENRCSVARLAELDASVVCFGHGPPLMQGAAEAMRAFARRVVPR